MEGSTIGGGILSGSSGGFLDLERHEQAQMGQPSMTHQTHQMHHTMSMMGGLGIEQPVGFVEAKELGLKGLPGSFGKGKGIAPGSNCGNNTGSEEDEPSFTEDVNGDYSGADGKKGSPWQRMKWTDNVVRLLIGVVASVGDDSMHDVEGLKRKSGTLQKKGKWKMVSKVMISKGCYVSPQQCEDKFNDLNKRYKKLNDILGRGTSCRVVETPSLMESMPHLTAKMKEDVKKILNSKHLFYREMCAYHNGQPIPGCHDIDLQIQSLPFARHSNDNDGSEEEEAEGHDDSEDDTSDNEDGKNSEMNSGRKEYYAGRSMEDGSNIWSWSGGRAALTVLQDPTKSPSEHREWIKHQMWQLQQQKLRLQAEELEIEKQRFKWLRFRSKKDREMERLRLENDRLKLENDRMLLLLKHKELELGIQRSEASLDPTALSINRVQARDETNPGRLQ